MSEMKWRLLVEVSGSVKAEILRGLLEAQEIQVVLSQEGAGIYAYPVTVGEFGKVEIFVPESQYNRAENVLDDFYSGAFDPGSEDTIPE